MKSFRRTLALVLAVAMVLTTFGMTVVSAAQYNDTEGHWAASYIDTWSGYGVIQGDGGYFRPDDAITRAEVAQVTQNVIGYIDKANNKFTDVSVSDWFADAVLRLVAAGTLTGNGDGTMTPNNYMTREEAMTMLARAYGLTVENSQAGITQYADYQNISDYATGYVGAMTAAGYIGGYEDGTIRPKDYISRAEFVKIIDNMIKLYITEPGSYGPQYAGGIVMIKTGGVTLNGIVAQSIVISPQVSGDVTITGSQVSGSVVNMSRNANVSSNISNVVTPNATAKPDNTYFRPNSGGSSGGNVSPSSDVKLTFYVDSKLYATKTITKNTYLQKSNRPEEPSKQGFDFVGWYLSQNLANDAENNEAYDFDSKRITKSMKFYAGFVSNGSPTANPEPTATPSYELESVEIDDQPNVYVGDTLTANVLPEAAKEYVVYQWYRDISTEAFEPIEGADSETYSVQEADQGHILMVVATAAAPYTGEKFAELAYPVKINGTASIEPQIVTIDSNDTEASTVIKFAEKDSFDGVSLSDKPLSSNDYVYNSDTNTLTINKDYLSGLQNGVYDFVINTTNTDSDNPVFRVVIENSVVPTAVPEPTSTVKPDEPTAEPTATAKPEEPTPIPTATAKPEEPTPIPTATAKPEEPTPTPTATEKPEEPTPTPTATIGPDEPTASPTMAPTPNPVYMSTVSVTGGTAVLKQPNGEPYPLAKGVNYKIDGTKTYQPGEEVSVGEKLKVTFGTADDIKDNVFNTAVVEPVMIGGVIYDATSTGTQNAKNYSSADKGSNGTPDSPPNGGAFYIFKPAADGRVEVAIGWGQTKPLSVVRITENGVSGEYLTDAVNGKEYNHLNPQGEGTLQTTVTFDVTSGATYYLFLDGSKPNIYGFSFTELPIDTTKYLVQQGAEVVVDAVSDDAAKYPNVKVVAEDKTDIATAGGKFIMPGQNVDVNVTFGDTPDPTEPPASPTPTADHDQPTPTVAPETPTPGPPTIPPATFEPTQTPGPSANPENVLTVDGSKDTDEAQKTFKTVSEALVYAGKLNNHASEADRIEINIVPGTYREQLDITVPYLTMQKMDGTEGDVLLTWYYGIGYMYYSADTDGYYSKEAYERNKALGRDALNQAVARWGCSTHLNAGNFIGKDLIFENSFNRYVTEEEIDDGVKPAPVGGVYSDTGGKPERTLESDVYSRSFTERAAAIAIEDNDKVEFYNCSFKSSQDTLYSGSKGSRVYFKNCTIEGQTDYIFGGNTLVFDNCNFNWAGYSKSGETAGGHVTACKNASTKYGYLMWGGKVSGASTANANFAQGDFGRPWGGKDSPTAAIGVKIDNITVGGASKPAVMDSGWGNWSTVAKESGYYEYGTVDASGNPINLDKRNCLVPNEWEVLAINPYDYLIREGDDWDPMAAKTMWGPVKEKIKTLELPESDTIKKLDSDSYEVSGDFTLPSFIEGFDGYDVHFESENEYLNISENGEVSVIRPVSDTIPAEITAYIRRSDNKLIGTSKTINITITRDPSIDPSVFNAAMQAAKDAIDSNYQEKAENGDAVLDRTVVIPEIDSTGDVAVKVWAEYSGFINDDGTIIRNPYGESNGIGNVTYTIQCVKGSTLLKETVSYDVSIPTDKADILYADFENKTTKIGGNLTAIGGGNNSGYAVTNPSETAFNIMPLAGGIVKVSYDVYGNTSGIVTLKDQAGADYLAIVPEGLESGKWNTVEAVINTTDNTVSVTVNSGTPTETTAKTEITESNRIASILFAEGTYDNIAVAANTDKSKAYSTFWKADPSEVGTPQGTYLMRGLTILYSPDKQGNGGTVDGINFPMGLSSGSNNGSWSNGVVPDGKNGLKFVAPGDGTWTVYALPGSGKTFYMGNAESSVSLPGTNVAVKQDIAVEKGKTYYATVAGSKGNFLGSKFTAAVEGEDAVEVYLTATWDFQKNNGFTQVVNAGESYDYTVKDSENAGKTMTIKADTGKFGGSDHGDWIAVNPEVTLTVPVVNGSVITMGDTYYGTEQYTINGETFTGGNKSYTYYGLEKTIDIVLKVGGFYRSVSIVSPKYPSTEIPTAKPSMEINGMITGLTAADSSAEGIKLIGKMGGELVALDIKDGKFTTTLQAGKSIDVTGILGGSSAYTIPADTKITSDNAAPTINAVAVVAEPAAGSRTYNFGDGSIVPQSTAIGFDTLVAPDGLLTFRSVKFHDTQHGVQQSAGAMTVEIPVAEGSSAIVFKGCAYASATITASTEGVAPASASLKTANDGDSIEFNYSGEAKTLVFTIDSGSIYVHGLSVTTKDASEPTATPNLNKTVTFSLGETVAEGDVPAAVEMAAGAEVEIPVNRTVYLEGKTLTGWTDGTTTVDVGSKYTVQDDVTLTPVFADNTASLSGTVVYDFQRQNGTPTVQWQGVSNFLVYQAVSGSDKIDVKFVVDTTSGKFANGNWTDWAQVNTGTKFTVPVVENSVVTVNSIYSEEGTYTINGVTKTGSNQSETMLAAGTCDIVAGSPSGSYWKSVTVTYPESTNPTATPGATDDPDATVSPEPSITPEPSATPASNKTVTFSLGDTGAEGDAPDAIEEAVGTEVEIPVNRTVYLEGKTLTGWTDGTDTFDIGSKYTVQDDVTLTPVFAENTEALSGTVVYDFQRQNGAPTVQWQGVNKFLVYQAVNGSAKIDVKFAVDTTNGKFANASWTDWAQVNTGTKFTVPVAENSVVTVNNIYSEEGTYTINGVTKTGSNQSETVTAAGTCDIVAGNPSGNYWRSITVTYPESLSPTEAPTEAPTNPPVEPINFTLDLTDIPVGNIANGETVAGLKAGLGTAAEGDISVAEVNGEKVIEVKDAAAGQNSVTWEAPSNITTGVITITTEFTAINESSAADINFNRVNGKNFAYFQTKFGSTKSNFYLNAGNKDDKLKLTKDKKYKLVSVFDYNTNNVTITLSEGDNVLASHDSDTVSAFTDLAAQGAISNIMICQTGNGYTAGTVSADLYINSFTVSQEL